MPSFELVPLRIKDDEGRESLGNTYTVFQLEITVKLVLPEILPEVAVMVAVPVATALPSPLLSTVATGKFNDFQVTWVVISKLVPSEYVPVAVSC
jgi:hypothetical protein